MFLHRWIMYIMRNGGIKMAKKRIRKEIQNLMRTHRELTTSEITIKIKEKYVHTPNEYSIAQLCRNIPGVYPIGQIDTTLNKRRLRVTLWGYNE